MDSQMKNVFLIILCVIRAEVRLPHHLHAGRETTQVNLQAEVHICIPIPHHLQRVHQITTLYQDQVAVPHT